MGLGPDAAGPAGLELARKLEAVPGVIEHGLFLGDTVERVVVASADGVHEMERAH